MTEMRIITAHGIDGDLGDMNMRVSAHGPYGPGGAQAEYAIGEGVDQGVSRWLAHLRFQVGNPAEGVNGVTLEALLAVCLDRLSCFQSGPHANAYNAESLAHIEKALEALKDRTRERDSHVD
ncbi:hypothetical protein NFH98_20840 [Halomonas sp. H33-56]|uniref:hypothetical protein n=1 Tax=Halomonas sp. H33-56 TaxID=2950873 RepID=UPI0032DE5DBE